jgi:hypothetical protein
MPLRLLTLVLCLLVSLTAFGADVAALAELYDKPTLGMGKSVSKLSVQIGSLELQLTSGALAPVTAGNDPIGVFFSGQGTFAYRTKDPVERSLAQFEAKKVDRTATLTGDVLTISGTFERLFIRAGGVELPVAPADAGDSNLILAFQKHRDDFRNVLWDPPSHLLIRQRLDSLTAQVAVVEIGGRDNQGYILDTIEEKEERFQALITRSGVSHIAEFRSALFPVTISEQPVGRARSAFMHPRYLLVDLNYTLVAGDKAAMKLSVEETLVPRNSEQSVFRFNLLTGKRDGNNTLHRMVVDAVTDAAGKPLPFHFERGSLLVGLPAKAPAEQPVVIKFALSGDILLHPNNDNFWQLGTEAWFPQPGLNGQYYTIRSIVKVKKPWIAFASGETVKRSEEGDYNVFENAFDKPLQFAVVHAGKYTVHEEKFEGLTIRVAPYAGINDAQVGQLARLAYKIIKFYEPWLGPFPFKEYNIIELNDLGWGQAPPGMLFITKEAFNPLSTTESRFYSNGVNQRFAHEIAHQYWGIVVKMGSEEEQWLTEAFAEFSSSLVVKEIQGQRGYDSMVARWRADAKDGGSFAPIALANRIDIPADPYVAFEDYFDLVYNKGAYVLSVLRKQLGDPKFFSFLRTVQGQHQWRFLTTNDAAKLLDRMNPGTNHQQFFDRYVWGTEMPVMPK